MEIQKKKTEAETENKKKATEHRIKEENTENEQANKFEQMEAELLMNNLDSATLKAIGFENVKQSLAGRKIHSRVAKLAKEDIVSNVA